MVAAGFTHSYSAYPNNDAMATSMDAAQAAGLKLMIATPELEHEPEATVRRFKDHPALGGYFLKDEPKAKLFPYLGAWVRRIQAIDAQHPCYVNLLPDYASSVKYLGCDTYEEYVERFVAQVPTPMISFDHYPVTSNGLRPSWYHNLELIAAAAKKANRPFWAFALSVPHQNLSDIYPPPTLGHIRLQVFSDLAYGAQVIQYFTYWHPNGGAPINAKGQRTPMYAIVKQANAEIKALSPVFVGATVESIGHTGEKVPQGTRRYEPAGPVRKLQTMGVGAVVSHLRNGDHRYLVVVNRDYANPTKVTIELDPATPVARVIPLVGSQSIPSPIQAIELSPGNMLVLTWPAK
jgi:hypothetical protein